MQNFIQQLPKAELHIHIEGSLEPQMLLDLATKNKVAVKYSTIHEAKQAYRFNNLQEFLNLYYQGMSVLITEDDFYQLTYAYLLKAHDQNVKYTEIFFDPQAHLSRGVQFATVINGLYRAIEQAKLVLGIEAALILCFLRDLAEDDAIKTLELALDYRDKFIGVGLDSAEINNPPSKFKHVFALARDYKLHLVAHAGEEGSSQYIWDAIDILGVERIDHGVQAMNDFALMKRLAKDKIPLTMCPLSNQSLQVVPDLTNYPIREFLNAGMTVTINSDDPAYFGGYINANYLALAQSLNLTRYELDILAKNSLQARFHHV